MAETVTEARRPDATAGTDAIYRSLFDSFNPDKNGRISPLEVLSRLERSGLQPGDPLSDAKAGGHTEIATLLREHTDDNALLPRRADKREAGAA